jgi:hypothetical protein
LITRKKRNNQARIGLWDECLITRKKRNNQTRIGLWDECLITRKKQEQGQRKAWRIPSPKN